MSQADILIVDDEANTLASLARAFRLAGHEATVCDNAAKALELEAYNRATGERPINVAFLSGSQKFRVAVSVALTVWLPEDTKVTPLLKVWLPPSPPTKV